MKHEEHPERMFLSVDRVPPLGAGAGDVDVVLATLGSRIAGAITDLAEAPLPDSMVAMLASLEAERRAP